MISLFLIMLMCIACSPLPEADLVIYNARLITMNDAHPEGEVIVIREGKILEIGNSELKDKYRAKQIEDAAGAYLYPGFIDAHCHFYGYATTLLECDLSGTRSWEEVLQRLDSFAVAHPEGWLTGRGWDQNDWEIAVYPDNGALNIRFPDRPVLLRRVDGHGAIANAAALALAGISSSTHITGGEIEIKHGKPTGILVDNAVDAVKAIIPSAGSIELMKALQQAEQNCYAYGLTTLADAGLDVETCLMLDSLHKEKQLSIFLYMMLNPTESGLAFARKGIYETEHAYIGSFKIYADGALGSRGARLKQAYCDRHTHSGLLLNDTAYFNRWCRDISALPGYQANTHCIGDSAVRLLLETYGRYLGENNDRRWRIEHAQVLDTQDVSLFSRFKIIPSVQPTHAVSDGPWAATRLCDARMPGAYAYKTLLGTNGYLPLGTDFPVELPDPLRTWYAAVYRSSPEAPEITYGMQHALSTEEALKGMTIWAAKACKLEHRKGMLKPNMDADIVMLNRDLRNLSREEFTGIQVLGTIRAGVKVFGKPHL